MIPQPKRPTPEAVEASLSAHQFADENGILSEDTKVFLELVHNHEELKREMIGLAAFMCDAPESFDRTDWKNLATSGYLNAGLLAKINVLCDLFFWVGWHSRGAIEDAERMEGMSE